MFSAKCANPDCTMIFDYRQGRFFRFHEDHGGDRDIGRHAVRHFWLCDPCSQEYILLYADGTAVLVRLELQQLSEGKKHLLTSTA